MIAVIVATLRRPELIGPILDRLGRQTRKPDWVLLCGHEPSDVPDEVEARLQPLPYRCQALFGELGLTKQRNNGLAWLRDNTDMFARRGMVVFFDDDFVMREDWLEAAQAEFDSDSGLAGLDGVVLADGVHKGGHSLAAAEAIIAAGRPVLKARDTRSRPGPMVSLYGCNMIARSDILRDLTFDEGLPYYAWMEDYDFSIRVGRHGSLKRSSKLVGVHLGSTKTRSSGLRTGYSQIANPYYLVRKGTMPPRVGCRYIFTSLVVNALKSPFPAKFVDWRGRLAGNMRAVADLLRGRLSPHNIGSM